MLGIPGEVTVQRATVTLTDAQIKALPTTAVEIIPANGASKINVPLVVRVGAHLVAGYTNFDATFFLQLINDAEGDFDSVSLYLDSSFLDVAGNYFSILPPALLAGATPQKGIVWDAQFSVWDNKPTKLGAANGALGNLTGGNAANTIKVTVFYVVVDV